MKNISAHYATLLSERIALAKQGNVLSVGLPLKLCVKKTIFVYAPLIYLRQSSFVPCAGIRYAPAVHMTFLQSQELLDTYNQSMDGILPSVWN